jgi:hypothetical protein
MKRFVTALALLATVFSTAACSPNDFIKSTITAPSQDEPNDPHSFDGSLTNGCGAQNCKDAY